MNVQELINAGANVCISISPGDLVEFALTIVNEMKQAQEHEQQPESFNFMSADEVAGVLNVTKGTLWRWGKTNYLKPVRCGRKLYYKRDDVMRLLGGCTCPAEGEKRSSHSIPQNGNIKWKGGAAL